MGVGYFRNLSCLSRPSASKERRVTTGNLLVALSHIASIRALLRSTTATGCGLIQGFVLSVPSSTEMRASADFALSISERSAEDGSTGSLLDEQHDEELSMS